MLVDEPDSTGVYYFATIPEMRRKGVARSMMNEICRLSRGKKILCIDIDAQGNLTTGFGIRKKGLKYSAYEVLTGKARIPT